MLRGSKLTGVNNVFDSEKKVQKLSQGWYLFKSTFFIPLKDSWYLKGTFKKDTAPETAYLLSVRPKNSLLVLSETVSCSSSMLTFSHFLILVKPSFMTLTMKTQI